MSETTTVEAGREIDRFQESALRNENFPFFLPKYANCLKSVRAFAALCNENVRNRNDKTRGTPCLPACLPVLSLTVLILIEILVSDNVNATRWNGIRVRTRGNFARIFLRIAVNARRRTERYTD